MLAGLLSKPVEFFLLIFESVLKRRSAKIETMVPPFELPGNSTNSNTVVTAL